MVMYARAESGGPRRGDWMHDGDDAMQRGYRYYKQLEAERRGYAFVRDTIAEFLINRRWELGQRDQVHVVALQLVDALMSAGALALYQCGIDVENSGALKAQELRKVQLQREAEVTKAAEQARDEERRRVDQRIAELEQERELERYEAHNRRELERAQRELGQELPEIKPVKPAPRRKVSAASGKL